MKAVARHFSTIPSHKESQQGALIHVPIAPKHAKLRLIYEMCGRQQSRPPSVEEILRRVTASEASSFRRRDGGVRFCFRSADRVESCPATAVLRADRPPPGSVLP